MPLLGGADAAGITPALWPEPEHDELAVRQANASRIAESAGPGPGAFGGLPATPELLDAVDKLPPATDRPELPGIDLTAPDPRFRLAGLLRPVRWALLFALALVAVDALASVALPALVRTGVDGGVSAHHLDVVWLVSGVALAVVVVDWLVLSRADGDRDQGRRDGAVPVAGAQLRAPAAAGAGLLRA